MQVWLGRTWRPIGAECVPLAVFGGQGQHAMESLLNLGTASAVTDSQTTQRPHDDDSGDPGTIRGRVLVTGATGFVGRRVAGLLSESGWRVTAGVRSPSLDGVEGCGSLVLGDLEDYSSDMDLPRFDAVIHLAARVHQMHESSQDEGPYEAANVRATVRLAEAAARSGAGHFVFLSSIKVNGESFTLERPASESLTPMPQGPYARSKARAERVLLDLNSPMAVTIIRSPLVYGPGVAANFGALLRVARHPVPLPLGAVEAPRSMISVGNLASAIVAVLEGQPQRRSVFVVRDGRDLPVRGVIRQIRRALGKPNPQLPVPPRLLSASASAIGRRAQVARLTEPLVIDDSAIRTVVGWRPVQTVEQGLEESLGMPPRPLRLLLVVSEDWYFWSHRRGLARRAVQAGWDVHLACRVSRHEARIREEGTTVHPIRIARASLNPFDDLRTTAELRRVIGRVRPDVVHNIAIKPIIYGSLAARSTGVPGIVNTAAGLGGLFSERGAPAEGRGVARRIVESGLRVALRQRNSWLVVQNSDDYALAKESIVDTGRLVLIPGSGLNLADYPFSPPVRSADRDVVVTHVSRMLWDKGVAQAVEAVSRLRDKGIHIRLQIVGSVDPDNPQSIPRRTLEEWARRDGIEWFGRRDDVASIWRGSDVAVLASYYGEGIPRVLLEAAATGLPMIGCDSPGIRDLIEDGVNGLLVPPRDPIALADALTRLVDDPVWAAGLGRTARDRVVATYCDDVVLSEVLELYERVLGTGSPLG